MNSKILDDLDNFIEEFTKSDDFLRLKELKDIIDNKYFKLISQFKIKEDSYNQALKNRKYVKDFDKIQNEFKIQKEALYQKEEVKEYKKLERKLNNSLLKLSNDLSSIMSNKFELAKIIE